MARGFGSTLGVGATDRINTTLASIGAQRSYSVWTNRHGGGGGGAGVVFEKLGESSLFSSSTYQFQHLWSTGGTWTVVAPAGDEWHHLVIVYDGGSTANVPTIYVDGASVSVTTSTAATGTIVTNSNVVYLGNRDALNRNWDGMIAEFAVWDALLDAAEAKALGAGASPLAVRRASLIEYVPLLRDNVSLLRAAPTVSGTVVQPHPRVFYPGRARMAGVQSIVGNPMVGKLGFPLRGRL